MEKVLVGEGDDVLTSWYEGFDTPIEKIRNKAIEAESFDIPIDWSEIISPIIEVPDWVVDQIHNGNFDAFFSLFPEMDITGESWGGDVPGLSGYYKKVYVPSDRIGEVRDRLEQIVDQLEGWVESSGFSDKIRDEARR